MRALVAPWLLICALALAAPARAQTTQPGPLSPAYVKSQAMTVGTLYPSSLGFTPFAAPVRAIMIACTVAGNVSITLPDGSVDVLPIPVGLFVLPLGAVEVNSSGTTATATYWRLG